MTNEDKLSKLDLARRLVKEVGLDACPHIHECDLGPVDALYIGRYFLYWTSNPAAGKSKSGWVIESPTEGGYPYVVLTTFSVLDNAISAIAGLVASDNAQLRLEAIRDIARNYG